MKKALSYSFIIASLTIILVCGCKKDKASMVAPSLTTTTVSNVNFNSATSGGTITNNGGANVTGSGICWSKTNMTPTISDSVTIGTTASGSFTSTLNNLVDGATYYVRAYATNIAGTGYGNVVTFNTIVDTTKVKFTYNGVLVTYGVINSPVTGKKWMDRNLGAVRVATAYNDDQAYGDLFQWGRGVDGHQIRTSTTTFTLSANDSPGHSNFIVTLDNLTFYDWRNPQNNNLWQGNNGINNPCPSGWHVPSQAEWAAETGLTNNVTAYSQLKLTAGGFRWVGNGSLNYVGVEGWYWTSSLIPNYSQTFFFTSGAAQLTGYQRANGVSVRCIKN